MGVLWHRFLKVFCLSNVLDIHNSQLVIVFRSKYFSGPSLLRKTIYVTKCFTLAKIITIQNQN